MLLGKFARVAVGTKHIDYNGRLCMVSAGTAYKLTFGIDRATNPWPDLTKADVVLIAGSNVAECAPITTHYLWQCRENGGRADRGGSAYDSDHPQCGSVSSRAAGNRPRSISGDAARDRSRWAGRTRSTLLATRPDGKQSVSRSASGLRRGPRR